MVPAPFFSAPPPPTITLETLFQEFAMTAFFFPVKKKKNVCKKTKWSVFL